MAQRKLEVVITGDSKSAQRALRDVSGDADTFSGKMQSIGGKVNKALAFGFAGGVAGAVAFGPRLVELGGQLDAWALKVDTVFEGQAESIRKWADSNNEAFGVTDEELAGLAAGFGDLLKPMGFTADQAAAMSMDVVGLSGALSEWSGGQRSAAEVSDILAKAMLGERESLKELGISITEADVQARLAAKGQEKLTGAALEQAKAIATQELIFEKSTDAQAAYAAGGNKTIRASNKLKAVFGEVQVWLAEKLVPALASAGGWLADRVPPAMAMVQGAFEDARPHIEKIGDAFQAVIEGLRPVFDWFVRFAQENPKAVLAAVAVVVASLLVPAIWSLAAGMIAAFSPIYLIVAAVAALAAGLVWAYDNVGWFHDAVDAVASFLADTVWPILQDVAAFLVEKLAVAWAAVSDYISGTLVPTLQLMWAYFEENILPTLSEVARVAGQVLGFALGVARDAFQWVIEKGTTLVALFRDHVLPQVQAVASMVSTGLSVAFTIAQTAVGGFIQQAQALYDLLADIVGIAKDVGGAVSNIPGIGIAKDVAGRLMGGFAAGGRPPVGLPSIVGEKGPELFIPDGPGTIIPNHQITSGGAPVQMTGGGTTVVVNVAGHVTSDNDLVQFVRRGLDADFRRTYGVRSPVAYR